MRILKKRVFCPKGRTLTKILNIAPMMLFFVGILEMIIVTAWTKAVSKTQIFASGAITVVNILIWYYVLQSVVEDITNWRLILLYAFGCALGTVLCTWYFQRREKQSLIQPDAGKSN